MGVGGVAVLGKHGYNPNSSLEKNKKICQGDVVAAGSRLGNPARRYFRKMY